MEWKELGDEGSITNEWEDGIIEGPDTMIQQVTKTGFTFCKNHSGSGPQFAKMKMVFRRIFFLKQDILNAFSTRFRIF